MQISEVDQEIIDLLQKLRNLGVELNFQKQYGPKKERVFWSRKQTAKQLRISLPTLHEWTKNGTIKAYRIGTRVLYKAEDIENALEEVQASKKRKMNRIK